MICTVATVRPFDGGRGLLCGLDADEVRRDGTVLDQCVERVIGRVRLDHVRRRAVQLHQVEPVDVQVGPGPVDPRAEVLGGVALRDLVEPATHLGGSVDRTPGCAATREPTICSLRPSP
jgi:hypothetical protein